MGVRGGRDFYSSKWITAEIEDEQQRLHLVPIRREIDGYFIATVNGQVYAFKIDHSRIKIWYASLTKSFRVLHYNTAHYMPISGADCKELELMITQNGLPKIDKLMFRILEQLGQREKPDFKEHDLVKLVNQIKRRTDKNTALLRNMKTFLEDMNTKKIVTPVKRVSEFLHKDMIETDPRFIAAVGEAMVKADQENRRINNESVGTKKAWLKPLLIIMGIAVFGVVGYMVYDSGIIQGMLPDLSQMKPLDLSGAYGGAPGNIMSRYPDPVDLRLACDRGEVDCSTLPKNVQDMLKTVELPKAVPTQQTVNLTP